MSRSHFFATAVSAPAVCRRACKQPMVAGILTIRSRPCVHSFGTQRPHICLGRSSIGPWAHGLRCLADFALPPPTTLFLITGAVPGQPRARPCLRGGAAHPRPTSPKPCNSLCPSLAAPRSPRPAYAASLTIRPVSRRPPPTAPVHRGRGPATTAAGHRPPHAASGRHQRHAAMRQAATDKVRPRPLLPPSTTYGVGPPPTAADHRHRPQTTASDVRQRPPHPASSRLLIRSAAASKGGSSKQMQCRTECDTVLSDPSSLRRLEMNPHPLQPAERDMEEKATRRRHIKRERCSWPFFTSAFQSFFF